MKNIFAPIIAVNQLGQLYFRLVVDKRASPGVYRVPRWAPVLEGVGMEGGNYFPSLVDRAPTRGVYTYAGQLGRLSEVHPL